MTELQKIDLEGALRARCITNSGPLTAETMRKLKESVKRKRPKFSYLTAWRTNFGGKSH